VAADTPIPGGAPGQPKPAADARPRPPASRSSTNALLAIIRRGKRRDRLFGFTGAFLIFASLGALGVLIADLIHDGAPQLVHTHLVKEETGYPPSFLTDVVGKLVSRPALATAPAVGGGGEPEWVIEPEPLRLDRSSLAVALGVPPAELDARLAALSGQRVLLQGLPPDLGGAAMSPDKLAPLPPDAPEGKPGAKIHRNAMTGTLARNGDDWTFQPEPLVLVPEDVHAAHLRRAEGERVAVTKRSALRREVGRLTITNVSTLRERSFLMSMPASSWYQAGILAAAVGTLLVMVVTLLTALPLGVAAGVYLEEYGRKNWLTAIIEVNIANLAGVPSIIWGLLGLGVFVYLLNLEHSILTAGLTLGLLVLPIVIIATREAIRSVPRTIRDASFALGATKWQTVRNHVLPYSMSGILTGSIVALSRAIGETAPLIVIGAVVYIDFLPPPPFERVPVATVGADVAGTGAGETELRVQPFAWLRSPFTVLPIQMFDWTSRPEREFHRNAAAAGLVLIVMTLGLNATAIYLRARLRKRINW
jgi:phosphate transport system permease protein